MSRPQDSVLRFQADIQIVALTATGPGRASFSRIGFVPNGYEEYYLVSDQIEGKEVEGKMIFIYPGERFDPEKERNGWKVTNICEMVVRRT